MNNIIESLKSFATKSKRVWMVLKKPTRMEFQMTSKISAIGILIIGLIGFVISILMSFLF